MKTGILTFHHAHNYGAVLQAYALKKKLTRMGHEAHIVNYRNPSIEQKYQRQLNADIRAGDFLHPGMLKYKFQFMRDRKAMQGAWNAQWDRFEAFISRYLEEGPPLHGAEEIAKEPYDALIAGSDQIWTSRITGGLDRAYLLDFEFSGRKISYAASIAKGEIPAREKKAFRNCLPKFDFLSVREQSLAESIRQNYGLPVTDVLDPTLLLEAEDYLPLLSESCAVCGDDLFAYYVTEDIEMDRCVSLLSEKKKLRRTGLHYYMKKGLDTETEFADYGPNEFLSAIRNAGTVVTNSFHGTVFSILFQKDFYSICKDNARILNLLKALGLEDRAARDADGIDLSRTARYGDASQRLKAYRAKSEAFLERALDREY